MIKIKKIISGKLKENCYIVYDSISLNTIIIDPGEEGTELISFIESTKLIPELIINTHGHYDHTLANNKIRKIFNIPLAIHCDDTELLKSNTKSFILPEIIFNTDQKLKASFVIASILHTPGHTKGSICILLNNLLITGDTLFAGTIGRTDLQGGNYQDIINSINKIKKLDPSTIIYPGHGSITTLSNELKNNYFLNT
ncbi:MAG: MBL fold metallo-hydrolase [Endomicrobium sp.]|jgi:glyoxylase-like metal-dependent hydrolase (beta-lactamase superfamily II)|nr:MBL fold metallo-hydrolase [Endomicrobium sp.]